MLWKLVTFTWVWNQWTIFLILEMHCCVSEVSEWVNHLFLYFFHLSHILINDDVGFGGPKMHSRMKVAFFGIIEAQKRNLYQYLTQIWFNMLIGIRYYTTAGINVPFIPCRINQLGITVILDRKNSIFSTEGQLNSKCPFGVFKSPKKPSKLFPGFLP